MALSVHKVFHRSFLCRHNVRSGSIDAVPTWMVLVGIIAVSFAIVVISITW